MSSIVATIITDDAVQISARAEDDRLLIEPADLPAAIGWELKPQGLCQGDVCVPTSGRDDLAADSERVDLALVADALRRPFAVDISGKEATAVMGTAAATRADTMATLAAPDVELVDLDDRPVALSTFSGKKKLLVAWASW
jgi:hypothetical protein